MINNSYETSYHNVELFDLHCPMKETKNTFRSLSYFKSMEVHKL